MKYAIHFLIFSFLVVILFFSCDPDKNRKKVDLSDIHTDLEIERFEQDLVHLDTTAMDSSLAELKNKYGEFFLEIYFEKILNVINPLKDEKGAQFLKYFVKSPPLQQLHDTVYKEYHTVENEEEKLEKAFSYFSYYFPAKILPGRIYSMISEFGYGAVTIDSHILAIGLDLYLGEDYLAYHNFFPSYLIAKFKRERIVVDCMNTIYNFHFENDKNSLSLIYSIIEEGKRMVFLESVLPDEEKHILFAYTKEEYSWCKESESSIWQFMIDQELLFKEDIMDKRRFIGEGPTMSGMPDDAPGNIGPWIGYRIVKSYQRKNRGDLPACLETAAEEIYKNSKYKPSR